jgi:CspA family cold shock protein
MKIRYKKIRTEKGIVQYWDEQKGYGLIQRDEGGDIFVYKKDLDFLTLLDVGDEVDYEIEHSIKGPRAINVIICKDSLFRSKREPSISF